MLAVHHRQGIAIGHLARHLLAAKPKALCQRHTMMTNPIGGSTERLLPRQIREHKQRKDHSQFVAFSLFAYLV